MKSGDKQSKVKTVMKEWKEGKLKSSSGDKVTNPKQAIAIALSEAGMSKNKKYKGGSMKKYEDGGTVVTDSELERFKKELSSSSLTGAQRERYEELRRAVQDATSGSAMTESELKRIKEQTSKRGGGAIMASKKSTMGEALKRGGLFKGAESYSEELAEAKSVKSGKTSPSEFVKGEKSEGHKGEEKNLSKQAKDIKSGKVSPESYAKMEASEPEGKRGGGAIMASKQSTMGEALRGGGAIMASKSSTMGEALSKGGEVKGTGVAVKGFRPAKMC